MNAKETLKKIKDVLNEKTTKACLTAGSTVAALGAAAGVSSFASGGEGSTIQDAFSTGINTVKDDFMGFLGVALPVALGIAGVGMAITLGWRYFKKIGK